MTCSQPPHNCSPISWNAFFDRKEDVTINNETFNVYRKGTSGPLFLLLHGAGYTGLSWAVFSKELIRQNEQCQILAPDLRGHGETKAIANNFSIDQLIEDVCNIYKTLFAENSRPPLILVGHSMGGVMSIHIAHSKLLPSIWIVAAIDIVEGPAISSLLHIRHSIKSQPEKFASEEEAIKWCLKSGVTKNQLSARVSMPARIKRINEAFYWRTNLLKTEPYWKEWFKGLSKLFLECEPVKLLILANIDRLDKELTMGQMRGAFQLEVLPKVGHCIHEDSPGAVAEIFINLVKRLEKFEHLKNMTSKKLT